MISIGKLRPLIDPLPIKMIQLFRLKMIYLKKEGPVAQAHR
jgi:hypothetical protein